MTKKTLIIIGALVVVGAGLFLFRSGGGGEDPDAFLTDTNGGLPIEDGGVTSEFINDLLEVNNVSFDTSIINSPVFKSLVPSGAFVDPNPPRGKQDPFSLNSSTPDEYFEDINPILINPDQSNFRVDSAMNITKITSTTAVIEVSGINSTKKVEVSLSSGGIVTKSSVPLIFNTETANFTAVLTGLKTATKYTATLTSPPESISLKAEFTTR